MIQSAGNCIGAGGREGEEEQTFSASPTTGCWGGNNAPSPIYPLYALPGSGMGVPDAVSIQDTNGDWGPVVFCGG